MATKRLMAIALVWFALAGCSQLTVTTDHDRSANFTTLHAYDWRPGPQQGVNDPRIDSSLIDARVRAAVDRVLTAKGYEKVAPGATADFFVGYHAVVLRKTSVQTINTWYGYRYGGWGWPQTYAYDYDEGTLLIDVIDPATMKLLWRGSGTRIIDVHASAEKRERRINDAVERILAKFPPS